MDNLSKWRAYMSDVESPDIFIDWGFHFLISAALQRRVWYGHDLNWRLHPNIFVLVIGPPAVGKTMCVVPATNILNSFEIYSAELNKTIKLFPVAPDSTTLEALTMDLARSARAVVVSREDKKKELYAHSSMAVLSEELGALFRKNQDDLVSFICQVYDSRNYHRKTKSSGEDNIKNVCVTIFAATTPEWIKKSFSTNLLGEGFMSRVICVYGAKPRFRRAVKRSTPEQLAFLEDLKAHVKKLHECYGECLWTAEAEEFYRSWYEDDFEKNKINKDKKLEHYYGRKNIHIRKLAMIMKFADCADMTKPVELAHVAEALRTLNKTEHDMHLALSSVGRNELHDISNEIYEFVRKLCNAAREKGDEGYTVNKKVLRLQFDSDVNGEELDRCLEYLQAVDKLTQPIPQGYRIKVSL